jgi:hypothetical protein
MIRYIVHRAATKKQAFLDGLPMVGFVTTEVPQVKTAF